MRELPPGQCIVSTPFFRVALAPGPPATRCRPGLAAARAAAAALATASAQVRVRSGVIMRTVRPRRPGRFPENADGAASLDAAPPALEKGGGAYLMVGEAPPR